jgi:hypothetical protein
MATLTYLVDITYIQNFLLVTYGLKLKPVRFLQFLEGWEVGKSPWGFKNVNRFGVL